MPTPLRAVRVPDDLWEAARAQAHAEGTTVTAVILAALQEYTGSRMSTSRRAQESATSQARRGTARAR